MNLQERGVSRALPFSYVKLTPHDFDIRSPRRALIEQWLSIKDQVGDHTSIYTEAGYCLQYPAPILIVENMGDSLLNRGFWRDVKMVVVDVLNYEAGIGGIV